MSFWDFVKNFITNNKKNARFITTPFTKTYGGDEVLEIGLYDNKTPITDQEIGIEIIGGNTYTKKTDEQGIARLNINLPPKKYNCKCYWKGINGEYNPVTGYVEIIVKANTYMDGINLTKNECESTPYQCALYRSDNGERIKSLINIIINGRTYTREADNDGLYKLNINLPEGTYPIKATFPGTNLFNQSSVENTITINKAPAPEPPAPEEPKSYSEKILDYFESKFGEMSCIDDCLEAIQGRGYAYYYDDLFDNFTAINRMYDEDGDNCTDACHVFWHLAVALGYRVEVLHIQCQGGDGHVRLELEREGTGTFYRDPAACLDGSDITYNWCSNGYLIDTNPDWFFENLYR